MLTSTTCLTARRLATSSRPLVIRRTATSAAYKVAATTTATNSGSTNHLSRAALVAAGVALAGYTVLPRQEEVR
jgi:hypothetical protein